MKTNKGLATLEIASFVSIAVITGCKKDESENPTTIPVQTTDMATVPQAVASNFAVLAGPAIASTGATTINGDLGLSPGSSIGGFPPEYWQERCTLMISRPIRRNLI